MFRYASPANMMTVSTPQFYARPPQHPEVLARKATLVDPVDALRDE